MRVRPTTRPSRQQHTTHTRVITSSAPTVHPRRQRTPSRLHRRSYVKTSKPPPHPSARPLTKSQTIAPCHPTAAGDRSRKKVFEKKEKDAETAKKAAAAAAAKSGAAAQEAKEAAERKAAADKAPAAAAAYAAENAKPAKAKAKEVVPEQPEVPPPPASFAKAVFVVLVGGAIGGALALVGGKPSLPSSSSSSPVVAGPNATAVSNYYKRELEIAEKQKAASSAK